MTRPIDAFSFGNLSRRKQRATGFFYKQTHTADLSIRKSHFTGPNAPLSRVSETNIPALLNQNPATFIFMSNAQRKSLKQDLLLAYQKLCQNYHFDDNEHRRQLLEAQQQKIVRCEELIQTLQFIRVSQYVRQADKSPNRHRPGKTLQIAIHNYYVQFSAGKSIYLRDWMNDLDILRSYFGWTGSLLKMYLELLPDNESHVHVRNAQNYAEKTKEGLGYLSWIFYYTRFLIHFCLLLKHTIRGSWMSAEEQSKSWSLRLRQQWQQRKFDLLGQWINASNNLVCFMWLMHYGEMGSAGNVINCAFLFIESLLTTWQRKEAQQAHQKEVQQLTNEIHQFTFKINNDNQIKALIENELAHLYERQRNLKKVINDHDHNDTDNANGKDDEQIRSNKAQLTHLNKLIQHHKKNKTNICQNQAIVEEQRARLIEVKEALEVDWKYKYQSVNADLYYNAIIITLNSILLTLLINDTASNIIKLNAISMIFTSAMVLLHAAYKMIIAVTKIKEEKKSVLAKSLAIYRKQGPLSELDYLTFLELDRRSYYLDELRQHEELKFIITISSKVLIPILIVMACALFQPIAPSFVPILITIAIMLVVGKVANWLIERSKPGDPPKPAFVQSDYEQFNRSRASFLGRLAVLPALSHQKPSPSDELRDRQDEAPLLSP